MAVAPPFELDAQYRVLREGAGFFDRSDRGKLLVRGDDAAEFLQGQLTNEIESMESERGCYAALLNRKGHVQADMRVLRLSSGDVWLDTEADATAALYRHLDTYKIGRRAEVEDVSDGWSIISVIGPKASETAGAGPLPGEHAQRFFERDGLDVLAVATHLGVDLIARPEATDRLKEVLESSGAVAVSEQAAEIRRVESGRPRFGREMSEKTMPAEAGIVDRAVDFTKGCYIGQEPVARLHHRGKPNRVLRGLRLSAMAESGETLHLGEREVGDLGTVCLSPALGPIALAIVRREAQPGDTLAVGAGALSAELVELPFDGASIG